MKEARWSDYDLVEANMDGVQTRISRMCEKGIRMRMPFARTRVASVIGFRGAVGMAARGLDWEVRHP